MRRFLLTSAAPIGLLLLLTFLPLILGWETLFLRDTLSAHLPLKAQQAQVMSRGELPLVGPLISGGQPLVGNPNAVPLYPDNLLYLVAPLLWAFNAHFWIHLFLAPWSAYALGRAWGLSRQSAWATGVFFGLSGYFVSQLNFYNLVAGVALAPALAAAALSLASPAAEAPGGGARQDRRWLSALALGLCWALLLLSGDPMIAALALATALAALLCRSGLGVFRPGVALPVAGSLACGTLLAAPQLLEFLRILPLSYRGHQGFSVASATVTSLDPRQAAEWFLPFFFGQPDVLREGAFWGQEFFSGRPPFYFSLYSGLLVFALIAASGFRLRRRPEEPGEPSWGALRLWAWLAAGGGLFLALGSFNPGAVLVLKLSGGLLRYPIKFWLPVALAAAVLAGLGFERAVVRRRPEAFRRLRTVLLVALGGYAALWAGLKVFSGAVATWFRGFVPDGFPEPFAVFEVARWASLAALSALVLGLFLAALFLTRRRAEAGAALLLLLHAGTQLFFLRPAVPTQPLSSFLESSPLSRFIGAESRIVFGQGERLFGGVRIDSGNYPEPTVQWIQRQWFYELAPAAGVLRGLRYELNLSPEGLCSFLVHSAGRPSASSTTASAFACSRPGGSTGSSCTGPWSPCPRTPPGSWCACRASVMICTSTSWRRRFRRSSWWARCSEPPT